MHLQSAHFWKPRVSRHRRARSASSTFRLCGVRQIGANARLPAVVLTSSVGEPHHNALGNVLAESSRCNMERLKTMKKAAALGALWLSCCADDGADSGKAANGRLDVADATLFAPDVAIADAGVSDATMDASSDPAAGVTYTSTLGVPVDARDVSLCELAKWCTGGAALYTVDSITGFTEVSDDGYPSGVTYVQLSKLEDLGAGAAPEHPLARMRGGPVLNSIEVWDVALSVGEADAILLVPPSPETKGYYGLHPLAVFRELEGGYTNGQLFSENKADLTVLRKAFHDAVGPDGCVRDTLVQRTPVPQPPTGDVQIIGPTVTLEGADSGL